MKTKQRVSTATRKAPPQELPLREVVVQLAAKSRQLDALDNKIGHTIVTLEKTIRARRSTGGPVDVPFPPWGKLGWSGRRDRRWRLVVVDDELCEDLLAMPRECRAQACLILGRLVERLGLETTPKTAQKAR